MSHLSSALELYFSDEDDEVALENLREDLSLELAREVKTEWRRVLKRHNTNECLKLVTQHALRRPGDGEAAWEWLLDRYRDLESYFDLLPEQ
jgi:hypothetical protein